MKKIVRNHDEIMYFYENRYERPKQIHLKILELIKQNINDKNHKMRISDYGCAAGELEYVLFKDLDNKEIVGYEFVEKLIKKAKDNVKGVKFLKGDITKQETSKKNSNDFSISLGVLPIFDSFEDILSNLIYWTKPGGFIFLHSLFNDFNLDVYVKYNHSEDYYQDFRESGWNIFSKKSISNFINSHNDVLCHEYIDFKLDFELEKQSDILRSWTIDDYKGKKLITNGLCLLQPHSILKIQKKIKN